jgi:hypothetical protein
MMLDPLGPVKISERLLPTKRYCFAKRRVVTIERIEGHIILTGPRRRDVLRMLDSRQS